MPTEATKRRRTMKIPNINKAAIMFAFWSYFGWSVLMWFSFAVVFYWLNIDGVIRRDWVPFFVAWSGFFLGFVVYTSSNLQTRRFLLIGWLRPSEEEWRRLDRLPSRSLAGSFFKPALLIALVMAVGLAVVSYLLGQRAQDPDCARIPFLFHTVILPCIFVLPISGRGVRLAVRRFVLARKYEKPLVIPAGRYIFLQNVLPYSLLSLALGGVIAFARFWPYRLADKLVPAAEFELHLSVTVLIISLLVVAVARFKTKVDALSPIKLSGRRQTQSIPRWKFFYAFALAIISYALTKSFFLVSATAGIDALSAIIVKSVACLLVSSVTTYWVVVSTLADLDQAGPNQHPYFQFAKRFEEKFLKES